MQRINITTPSFYVFCVEVQQAIQSGFEFDLENSPPVTWGIVYEASLIKKDEENAVQPSASIETDILNPKKRAGRPPMKPIGA